MADCTYKEVWTDEVGTIPVCTVHGNNSQYAVTPEKPNPPCLTVAPYSDFYVYYGDPEDPSVYAHRPPQNGDELCDGHQMHYEWLNGAWR